MLPLRQRLAENQEGVTVRVIKPREGPLAPAAVEESSTTTTKTTGLPDEGTSERKQVEEMLPGANQVHREESEEGWIEELAKRVEEQSRNLEEDDDDMEERDVEGEEAVNEDEPEEDEYEKGERSARFWAMQGKDGTSPGGEKGEADLTAR
jgi:hypothetical protein